MTEFLQVASYGLFVYYFTTNLIYLALLIESMLATLSHHRLMGTLWHERLRLSSSTPPISILVPARNEEKNIVGSVTSLLRLDYPEIEVIVVNDGSTDNTLAELQKHFDLLETDILRVSEIATRPVRGIYMSAVEPRLLVLDKESCGRKADALNAALNAASSPFVCAIDADAILERDALLRIMAPALTDDGGIVASGGIVRAANGSVIENGEIKNVRLPRRPLEALQVLEYVRSFLIGRQGWARLKMLLIISGAFGVFRRDLCRQIGGFRTSAIGEDMDLIVRLHRHLRNKKQEYRIAFVPDPVCWTEVPSTLKSLGRQRARWQNGLADVLWQNKDMLLNPRYGRIGLLAIPYQWVFELLAPVAEIAGWALLLLAGLMGLLSKSFLVMFFVMGYLLSVLISIGSVLMEEMAYHRYNDWRDLFRLVGLCFIEYFPYRPLNTIWRVQGLWQFVRGKNSWQLIDRVGLEPAPRRAP
jgi:cellulose synthase/poly-beta-1,6-N-acetylglucosamine synthase-like glycosyltransferase